MNKRIEIRTKINEEIRYKPVVAAIESTMFLKSELEKTSEAVRPPSSCARPWIPLTAMNMAANWMVQNQNWRLTCVEGLPHSHITRQDSKAHKCKGEGPLGTLRTISEGQDETHDQ